MGADKKKQGKRRWLTWIRDLAMVFIVVLLIQWWQTSTLASGPAPPLAGLMLSGETLDLNDLRGKPVLVHFWATWCPICRTEDGSIHDLAQNYQVLGIATNSGDAQEIRQYLDENKLDFPVMLDESGVLGSRWGVKGVPSSFVIDSSGEIRSVAVGYTTEIGLRIRLWLAGRG
jgi:thiol-disulfide isomerase/thioredoxin